MAGRRLRNAVKDVLVAANVCPGQEVYVTIAGLANNYASYVTTYEEYQAQRYEAASTIYGPYTHEGYVQEFKRIAADLAAGRPTEAGPQPPNLYESQLELMPHNKFDRVEQGFKFGDLVTGSDVRASYNKGEVVQATFHSANPRNNQRAQGTFLTVEKQKSSGRFDVVYTDGDWSTSFRWHAGPEDPLDFGVSAASVSTISWTIPADQEAGTYRVCYFGDHKIAKYAKIVAFSGCSSTFVVA